MSPTSFQTAPSRDIKLISQKRKADDRTRTDNLLITNQLLCQLSHIGIHNKYFIFSDSDGNRPRVTAVKGRCLNRLTTGPQRSLSRVTVLYNIICFCGMQVFLQIFFYFFITVQECNSYSPFFTSNLLIPIMLTVPSVLFVSISQLL